MNHSTLTKTLSCIEKVDEAVYQQALLRHGTLAKPPRSLGRLEPLGARLAAIQGTLTPTLGNKAVVVFAADHGISAAGVSAYPKQVTAGMVENFLTGGAAVNALASVAGAELLVVDVGVDAEFEAHPNLYSCKVARGTRNMLDAPAMTHAEAEAACEVGADIARRLAAGGVTLLAGGEMGIGNTTAAAALTSFFTGRPALEVTGRGTGLTDAGLRRKVAIVDNILARHQPEINGTFDALARLGGLEIAALSGFYLGAAAAKTPVLLDGFITTAAALIAVALEPAVKDYLFASHLSQEAGHQIQLEVLGLRPLFDLNLRLGEGSGAVLAFGILESAAAVLTEMATLSSVTRGA